MNSKSSKLTWHQYLLSYFEKWLHTYRENVMKAYDKINRELIPSRQYVPAMGWCMYAFDVTVLTHQMVSLVYETEGDEIRSAYYMPVDGLIDVLKRLENQMIQCRGMFDELITLNAIDRMYVAMTTTPAPTPSLRTDDEDETRPPTGVLQYVPDPRQADLMTDVMETAGDAVDRQLADIAVTLELLRAGGDRDAVRAENLENRLPPNNVRAIFLVVAPGDGELARTVIESYLAKLKETIDCVNIYRVDYGGLLSKWRGASEKNFENLMKWMVDRARHNAIDGRRFDALWFDNVHVLMGQRAGGNGAEDFLSVIKTTMLQLMDEFNKDRRLSRFALLFSTGASQTEVDAAFRRRMDGVYELPPFPRSPALRDLMVGHVLRVTKLNVSQAALTRLGQAGNLSELQSVVYAYYVRARFTIGTEFHVAEPGTTGYSLEPLKAYFNLNGDVVRTGDPRRRINQAVPYEMDGVNKRPRRFYRPDEVDPRNLSKHDADNTVYVVYDAIETEDENL